MSGVVFARTSDTRGVQITLTVTVPGAMSGAVLDTQRLLYMLRAAFPRMTIEQIQIHEVYETSKTPGLSASVIAGNG